MASSNPVLVELTRGGLVESVHRGAVAVSDRHGRLVLSLGDTEADVFPRSAFKMMQALPLIESGAADAFGVTPEELALACASHSGEAFHVRTVLAWLARIGAQVDDLACGPHLPLNDAASRDLIASREKPTRAHNNCSGKHTGFLTLAKHLGAPAAGYEKLDHPVQLRVRQAIAEICGMKPEHLHPGIDGCAAPNFAFPLSALARGCAQLADPVDLAPARAEAALRLQAAVRAYPAFVAGTGRACTNLIPALAGNATVKTGAEGVFVAVLPSLKLGVALKIDDGGTRASETAIARILVTLGVLDADHAAARALIAAPVTNWRGEVVGEKRPSAILTKAVG